MQIQLKAGWNERAEVRTGHRNGYYTRWLSSPHEQLRTEAACVFRCESFGAALDVAADWRVRWQRVHPLAADQFLYGLRDSLRFYDLPKHWWKRVCTNNPMERLIRTLRQRLRPMGYFQNEDAIEGPSLDNFYDGTK